MSATRQLPAPEQRWKEFAPRIGGTVDEGYRTIESADYPDGEDSFALTGYISPDNARLMAAAPDLLGFAKAVTEEVIQRTMLRMKTPAWLLKLIPDGAAAVAKAESGTV